MSMSSRDWQQDWELCEKATPGPWKAMIHDSAMINGSPADCKVWTDDKLICSLPISDMLIRHPTTGIIGVIKQPGANAQFISEAREALPYWLQRVKELEGELERLNRGNDELLRRANRMLAVVETAKKAKDFLYKLVVEETHMSEFYDAFYGLVASLEALEALEEEPFQEQAVRVALSCGSQEITEEAVVQVEQRLEQIRAGKEN